MYSDADRVRPTPASYADFKEETGGGWLRTLVSFFAIPLLIVCVAVGLYLGITLMVGAGPTSAADFVQLMQSDSINRRWQAAYELANRLRGKEVPDEFRSRALVKALVNTLGKARAEHEEPPRLAILVLDILGRLGDPRAIPAVRAATEDSNDWTRSHAVLALGALGDAESMPRLLELAHHPDPGTRQAALEALTVLDQEKGLPFHLSSRTRNLAREFLGDLNEDVRFTAALVLADAGIEEGTVRVLLEMLDRDRLETFAFHDDLGGIDRYKLHSNVILKAIAAVTKLGCGDDPRVIQALGVLENDDSEGDSLVRQAAREALRRLKPAAG